MELCDKYSTLIRFHYHRSSNTITCINTSGFLGIKLYWRIIHFVHTDSKFFQQLIYKNVDELN